MFTNCSFDATKNKLNCYRGEDCMERLSKGLREHAMKINNYKEKEMIQLTNEETKSYEEQKVFDICKKKFVIDKMRKTRLNYTIKSEIIFITLGNLEELLIVFVI